MSLRGFPKEHVKKKKRKHIRLPFLPFPLRKKKTRKKQGASGVVFFPSRPGQAVQECSICNEEVGSEARVFSGESGSARLGSMVCVFFGWKMDGNYVALMEALMGALRFRMNFKALENGCFTRQQKWRK